MVLLALGLGCDALFGASYSEDLLYADQDADGVTIDEGVVPAWFFDSDGDDSDGDDFGAGDAVLSCAGSLYILFGGSL